MSRAFFVTPFLLAFFLTMGGTVRGDGTAPAETPLPTSRNDLEASSKSLDDLIVMLDDPDLKNRRTAMLTLYATDREALKKKSLKLLPLLEAYAARWDGDGDRAVLLIGDLGDNSRTLFLRRLRQRAFVLYGQEDPRAQWSESIQSATLKALLKLYDDKATRSVQEALFAADSTAAITLNEQALSSRTLAIECVAFAGRKDFLQYLVLLLDDTINLIPNSAAEPPPRIRDSAAQAILTVSGIPAASLFQQEDAAPPLPNYRFSDEEIVRLRELLKAAEEEGPPSIPSSTDGAGNDTPPPVEPAEGTITPIVEVIPITPVASVTLPATSALAPPLGLEDVENLLVDTVALLRDNATTDSLKEHLNQAEERIELASDYLNHLTLTAAGRVRYQWIFFKKETVNPGNESSRKFTSGDTVKNVMAVRFKANERGSVLLKSMVVRDSEEKEERYEIGKLARGDIPKHEIVYLNRPTDVDSIVVLMQNKGDNRRRMYMDLGVPSEPEYARELSSLCRDTLESIRANQPLPAAQTTDQALILLRTFQNALK